MAVDLTPVGIGCWIQQISGMNQVIDGILMPIQFVCNPFDTASILCCFDTRHVGDDRRKLGDLFENTLKSFFVAHAYIPRWISSREPYRVT